MDVDCFHRTIISICIYGHLNSLVVEPKKNCVFAEPPVKILNADDDTDERCLSGEELVLSCELSRENVVVRWYKDGEKVEESEGVRLECDGRHRKLVILSAQPCDSGEFVCDAGDDSIFFNVTVKGKRVESTALKSN